MVKGNRGFTSWEISLVNKGKVYRAAIISKTKNILVPQHQQGTKFHFARHIDCGNFF